MSSILSKLFRRIPPANPKPEEPPKKPYFNSDDIPQEAKRYGATHTFPCPDCGGNHRPTAIISGLQAWLSQICMPCYCLEVGEAIQSFFVFLCDGVPSNDYSTSIDIGACKCGNHFGHVVNNHDWINAHGESKNDSAEYWKDYQ